MVLLDSALSKVYLHSALTYCTYMVLLTSNIEHSHSAFHIVV